MDTKINKTYEWLDAQQPQQTQQKANKQAVSENKQMLFRMLDFLDKT